MFYSSMNFQDTERAHSNQYIKSNGVSVERSNGHHTNGKEEHEEVDFQEEILQKTVHSHQEVVEQQSFRSFTLDKVVISHSVSVASNTLEGEF